MFSPKARITGLLLGCTLPLLAAAAGCGDRDSRFNQPLQITDPIVVGRHLAYLDKGRDRIILVRPHTRDIHHIPVGRRPSFMLPTPDGARLLVVCKGWVATTRDEQDEPPQLYLIDPADPATPAAYDLGSPYDEVAISADGRWAVAFFSASSGPGVEEAFRNPNAVAMLDLDDPTASPIEKTVRSFGDVPLGVLFSPANMAPVLPSGMLGSERTLAVVFADGYITFIDLAHPDRSEVTVHLALPQQQTTIIPQEMVFAPEAGTIFLRSSGSNDIYAFTLSARTPANELENDFVVSINTLAAGTTPADVGVFADAAERKILVANQGSQNLTVIDALTSQFVNINVADPVDRVLMYPVEIPYVALAYSRASHRSHIHFLNLEDVEVRKAQNLQTIETPDPVASIELIPGQAKALVLHDASSKVMSILDLDQRTLSPLTAHADLVDHTFTADGAMVAGFSIGWDQLGIIDLGSLAVTSLQLAVAPERILALQPAPGESPDAEAMTLIIDHGGPAGRITVVPHPAAVTRTDTYMISGFLLDGLLDSAL